MTVNDTHIILMQQARVELAATQELLARAQRQLDTPSSSRRSSTEARSISMSCAMMMRAAIAARVSADMLVRGLEVTGPEGEAS